MNLLLRIEWLDEQTIRSSRPSTCRPRARSFVSLDYCRRRERCNGRRPTDRLLREHQRLAGTGMLATMAPAGSRSSWRSSPLRSSCRLCQGVRRGRILRQRVDELFDIGRVSAHTRTRSRALVDPDEKPHCHRNSPDGVEGDRRANQPPRRDNRLMIRSAPTRRGRMS